MKKPIILFIQGGGEGGYEADKRLALYDETVPFSHLKLYVKKIPHATFREIPGRGHQLNNDLTEIVQDMKNLR